MQALFRCVQKRIGNLSDKKETELPTVAERIRAARENMTASELAVTGELMSNYPVSGLVPIVQLAAKANVSAPTVTRLIAKLGYSGFSEFHEALRREVQTRMFSPVDIYPSADATISDGPEMARARYVNLINATFQNIGARDVEAVIARLSDASRPVTLLGGRYSHVLASHLGAYLAMLRPKVSVCPDQSGSRISALVELEADSTVIVYDFRRYQTTSIDWGKAAAESGAFLVVITDQYLTPLSSTADALLIVNNSGLEPFDSMVGAMAVNDMLISEVARIRGTDARDRLAEFEQLQIALEAGNAARRP